MRDIKLLRTLRLYETAHRTRFMPENFVVARLDIVGCRLLCANREDSHLGVSQEIAVALDSIAKKLMRTAGMTVVAAMVVCDEINLIIHPDDATLGRDAHSWLARIASRAGIIAAEVFTELNAAANDQARAIGFDQLAFNGRMIEINSLDVLIDYFSARYQQGHDQIVRSMLGAFTKQLDMDKPLDISVAQARTIMQDSASLQARARQFLDSVGNLHYWSGYLASRKPKPVEGQDEGGNQPPVEDPPANQLYPVKRLVSSPLENSTRVRALVEHLAMPLALGCPGTVDLPSFNDRRDVLDVPIDAMGAMRVAEPDADIAQDVKQWDDIMRRASADGKIHSSKGGESGQNLHD